MFGGNFAPRGWAFCDGAVMAISQNDVLFSLIETTYGGDGQTTFNLPDMRGRLPVHQGSGFVIGQAAGTESVTLTVNQIPAHSHPLLATTNIANQTSPQTNVVAQGSAADLYIEDTPNQNLSALAISSVGGSQPHTNFQPYLCVDFIISLFGIYPSPT